MNNDKVERPDKYAHESINPFELETENLFLKAGGKTFTYSNDHNEHTEEGESWAELMETYDIPEDQRSEYGSGMVLHKLFKFAQKHALADLIEKDGKLVLKYDNGIRKSDDQEEIELNRRLEKSVLGDEFDDAKYKKGDDLEAAADKLLEEHSTVDEQYEEDFNYYMNLGFKDLLLELGYDGIQFHNTIEDKAQGDWSWIILDGSQFKNVKQRKPVGTGFKKDNKRHMSKYKKTAKYYKEVA